MKARCWIIPLFLGLYGCDKAQKPNLPHTEQTDSSNTIRQAPVSAPSVPEVRTGGDEKPSTSDSKVQTKSEKPIEGVRPIASAGDDPIVLAFGLGVKRLPAASVKPIPPPDSRVGACPPSVEEAMDWELRSEEIKSRQTTSAALSKSLNNGVFLPAVLPFHRMAMMGVPQIPPPDTLAAFPFLSFRAARRAIAENPNHPESYFAWYLALTNPELPISDSERMIGQVTALQQCLMRMAPPNQFREKAYRLPAYLVAQKLALFYYGEYFLDTHGKISNVLGLPIGNMPALQILLESNYKDCVIGLLGQQGQPVVARLTDAIREGRTIEKPYIRALDLAREMMVLAVHYGEKELAADNKELQQLKELSRTIENSLVQANKSFEVDKLGGGTKMKLVDQIRLALRHHLVGKALELLTDKEVDLQKEFGPDHVEAFLVRIALELATGSIEDVAEDLAHSRVLLETSNLQPNARQHLLNQLQSVTYQKLVYEGNYRDAGRLLDSMMATPQNPSAPPLRSSESERFYQRGLLSLIEGDIPTARKWFLQSRQPGIPERGVPAQHNENAERYLKLIEKAEDMVRK